MNWTWKGGGHDNDEDDDESALPEPEDEREEELLEQWSEEYTEEHEERQREPWEKDSIAEIDVVDDDGVKRSVTVIHDTSDEDGERWIESQKYFTREETR